MTFVRSGKVKDMYDMGNDILKFKFSDRVSAFDVKFDTPITQKDKILADFINFWFNKLNLDNHFICKVSEDEIVTTKLDMIPMECIVRGYFYGSYTKRYFRGEIDTDMKFTPDMIGAKFPKPIFDPTTKDEHDVPVTKEEAIDMKLVMEEEYKYLKRRSIEVYNIMYENYIKCNSYGTFTDIHLLTYYIIPLNTQKNLIIIRFCLVLCLIILVLINFII